MIDLFIAITNSNGDGGSPWNIPRSQFASAKFFPPAVNSTLQVFMVFMIKFMTSSDILYIWGSLLSSLAGPCHVPLLLLLSFNKDLSKINCLNKALSEKPAHNCKTLYIYSKLLSDDKNQSILYWLSLCMKYNVSGTYQPTSSISAWHEPDQLVMVERYLTVHWSDYSRFCFCQQSDGNSEKCDNVIIDFFL